MTLDPLSLTITPVSLFLQQKRVAMGTGFLYAETVGQGQNYISLVTNYHVLTGFAPGQAKTPAGDRIIIELRESAGDPLRVRTHTQSLISTSGEPMWITSPTHPRADVAIVPLHIDEAIFQVPPYCMDQSSIDYDIRPYPGQSVAVVGYPLAWRDKVNRMPVWKTGHIASEPDQDFDGEPRFLIDITGRPGMSGSPVVVGHIGPYVTRSGALRVASSGALMGVFASTALKFDDRGAVLEIETLGGEAPVSQANDRPELGFVWKASLIKEIVKSVNLPDWMATHLPFLQEP